jgi:hypothetical protein
VKKFEASKLVFMLEIDLHSLPEGPARTPWRLENAATERPLMPSPFSDYRDHAMEICNLQRRRSYLKR